MSKIFYLMGKSSSGKDTIYKRIMQHEEIQLKKVVPYTTRPIREGEREGVQYHFTDENGFKKLLDEGKVIEHRTYNTYHGEWKYFTVSEGINPDKEDYLIIGTPESYNATRKYYVEVGCNAVLNPGTILGRSSMVYPTSCVRGVVKDNHIYKDTNEIISK